MSASRGPYRFVNREYFIVAYETDYDKLKRVVPEPLEPVSNVVLCTCLPFPPTAYNYLIMPQF